MYRLVAILALCATAVFSQTNRGSISGTVTDQSEAVVPWRYDHHHQLRHQRGPQSHLGGERRSYLVSNPGTRFV